MKQVKHIYKLITLFLNRQESPQERRALFDWMDALPAEQERDEQELIEMRKNTRKRLLSTINKSQKSIRISRIVRYSSVAAAILMIGFLAFRYWPVTEKEASKSFLASISPGHEAAIITLADGQQINLDQLALNQSVQVGGTMISKDAQGKVSYRDVATGKQQIQRNTLYIPKGTTYDLILSDGTVVSLNADSKLIYPSSFEGGDRVVELEGEAYFHVQKTKNKARFIVKAGQEQTEVLGTKFNVSAYAKEQIQTALEEGSVIVSRKDIGQYVHLKPNEKAQTVQGKLVVAAVNMEDVLGWKRGQFCFDGTNTAAVMQEIARWYDIDVSYQRIDQGPQYSGKIPRNISLDKLIELLNFADLKTKAVIGSGNRIHLIIT
jgi:ferric-dicitrate binding protein FerR (iron transport regulator)